MLSAAAHEMNRLHCPAAARALKGGILQATGVECELSSRKDRRTLAVSLMYAAGRPFQDKA